MKRLRTHLPHMAACTAVGYLLLWLALVLSPCLMAMSQSAVTEHHSGMSHATPTSSQPAQMPAATEQTCEHCPPVACDLVQADVLTDDCDSINAVLQTSSPLDDVDPAPTADFEFAFEQQPQFKPTHYLDQPPLRAGPRRHLLFQQFNE